MRRYNTGELTLLCSVKKVRDRGHIVEECVYVRAWQKLLPPF